MPKVINMLARASDSPDEPAHGGTKVTVPVVLEQQAVFAVGLLLGGLANVLERLALALPHRTLLQLEQTPVENESQGDEPKAVRQTPNDVEGVVIIGEVELPKAGHQNSNDGGVDQVAAQPWQKRDDQ